MTDEPLDVEAAREAGYPAGQEPGTTPAAQEPGTAPTAQEPGTGSVTPEPGAGSVTQEQGASSAGRENKGSPDQPWAPDEQPYSDRPEQGGETPGPAKTEPPD